MDIKLSWDLFILVFFVVIVAYSLIIGRDNTLKVILGTYVATIAADATGSIFEMYFGGSAIFSNLLRMAAINSEAEAVVFTKVLVFVILVILFAVRGAFHVDTVDDSSRLVRFVLTMLYAVMSAALIISTILVFVSGISFIGGGSSETVKSALWDVYQQSNLIALIVQNSYFLFAIPALSFLFHSLYSTKAE